MLSVGSQAPQFALPDKTGKKTSLKDVPSQFLVVYFYPKDNTPGCTVEALEFTSELAAFKKRKAEVIGISGGDEKSKAKFCDKYNLGVTLLSDTDFSVAKKFGVFGEKSFMGRKFNGIFRSTFILDKKRRVLKVFDSVSAKGHAQEVLAFLDEASGGIGRKTAMRTSARAGAKKSSKSGSVSVKKGAKSGVAAKGRPKARRPR
jgi:peroxiredoxin Q/BCP